MAKGRVTYQLGVANQADADWVVAQINSAMDRPFYDTTVDPVVGPRVGYAGGVDLVVRGTARFATAGDELVIRDRLVAAWSSGLGKTKILAGSWVTVHDCLHDEGRTCGGVPVGRTVK